VAARVCAHFTNDREAYAIKNTRRSCGLLRERV